LGALSRLPSENTPRLRAAYVLFQSSAKITVAVKQPIAARPNRPPPRAIPTARPIRALAAARHSSISAPTATAAQAIPRMRKPELSIGICAVSRTLRIAQAMNADEPTNARITTPRIGVTASGPAQNRTGPVGRGPRGFAGELDLGDL